MHPIQSLRCNNHDAADECFVVNAAAAAADDDDNNNNLYSALVA